MARKYDEKKDFFNAVLAGVLVLFGYGFTPNNAEAEGWTHSPGETVGELLGSSKPGLAPLGGLFFCNEAGPQPNDRIDSAILLNNGRWRTWKKSKATEVTYMQFVHDTLVGGKCYYYAAGSSSGKSGQHTWRWDN